MAVYQTADLTASYSVALLAWPSSILLLIGTTWFGCNWRFRVTLCAVAALVGVGLPMKPARPGSRRSWWSITMSAGPFRCRYRCWRSTSGADRLGRLTAGFWRLVVVSVLMVFVLLSRRGRLHASDPRLPDRAGVLALYSRELYFGRMDEVVRASTGDYLLLGCA